MAKPLIQIAREATNWCDGDFSELLGIPKSSVHAIRTGRMKEKLSPVQQANLEAGLRAFIEFAQDALAEVEMRA